MTDLLFRRRDDALRNYALAYDNGELRGTVWLDDGTAWMHAATLGTRTKEFEFCIDKACVENVVRVFKEGYPRRVPLDYDHGLMQPDGTGNARRAGDVLEMRGAFDESDLQGMSGVVEKIRRAGRELADPRNLGLWVRVKPTPRAKKLIDEGEYDSMSIVLYHDMPHNVTGEGQGPAVIAISFTNLPFLDDLVPVAASGTASQRAGGSPADPGDFGRRDTMTIAATVLAALSATLATPIRTEDDVPAAVTAALQKKDARIQELSAPAAFGERCLTLLAAANAEEAVTKLTALQTELSAARETAKAATKARIDADVKRTIQRYETKLTKPLADLLSVQLRAELERGVALDATATVGALKSMGNGADVTGEQTSAADAGGEEGSATAADAPTSADVRLDAEAMSLMGSDPDLKRIREKDGESAAYRAALSRARQKLGYKVPSLAPGVVRG